MIVDGIIMILISIAGLGAGLSEIQKNKYLIKKWKENQKKQA